MRLGGGFMVTQGTNLVIIRRHLNAPRPGQFCECGGVFEVLEPVSENEESDVLNDYIASLLKESQEIILIRDDTLYIPQLAPSPSVQIGFQPPGTLSAYNKIIEEEVKIGIKEAHIPVDTKKTKRFWMKLLEYEHAVKLEFAHSPQLSVEITAEIDYSSLECVGVLSIPQDIDAAVIAYLEEEQKELEEYKRRKRNASRIKAIEKELQEARAERKKWQGKADQGFQYWDAELGWDSKRKKEGPPVDRDIHLINIENGDDVIWYDVSVPGNRARKSRNSKLWDELSSTKLGKTSGRFATEKIEKAIRMHCPYPRLQPLARF